MKKFTAISVLVILLAVSGIALVYGAPQANIPDRIASQQQRIDEGIASGKLTRGEADVLQDNLNWIRTTFARMKADGRLNPGEISKLEAMLERNSQMIANKKQNPITRVYQADIPERIANQQWRIDEGIASGKLTRGEADVLQDNLNWIRSTFARMKADRRLNPGEISKLEAMLDQNSQMIANKKQNPITRVYQADIPERIANQQWRIDEGVASRELTRGEADVLQDNLNWIRSTFARMKADGRLNQKEISKLEAMLDQNSQMISNKKNNPIKRVYQADILDRIANQQWRIDQGVASRELTRGEADVLQDNLNWIKATFTRMKADGRLNQKEISKLEAMLDQNSQMIFNKKHNPIKKVY
jgi:uncharacterized tellurite resistance protein B-like protein